MRKPKSLSGSVFFCTLFFSFAFLFFCFCFFLFWRRNPIAARPSLIGSGSIGLFCFASHPLLTSSFGVGGGGGDVTMALAKDSNSDFSFHRVHRLVSAETLRRNAVGKLGPVRNSISRTGFSMLSVLLGFAYGEPARLESHSVRT